jgi:hypothetical protein
MCSKGIATALVSASLCALAACHTAKREGDIFKPIGGPARTTALAAVENLRHLLNNGDCQAVYDQMFESSRPQSVGDWLADCRQIREKFGPWTAFYDRQAATSSVDDGRLIDVDGLAAFGGGGGFAVTGWIWSAGQLRLAYLSLQNGSEVVSYPDQASRNKYQDPRMERPRRPYGA